MSLYYLQCNYCAHCYEWDSTALPQGRGYCACKRAQYLRSINKNQYFTVLKEKPNYIKGFVRVYSNDGYQDLKGPCYQEQPCGWKKI
jgi:hypothetical protein